MTDPPRKIKHRETSLVRSCSSSELPVVAMIKRHSEEKRYCCNKVDSGRKETSVAEQPLSFGHGIFFITRSF